MCTFGVAWENALSKRSWVLDCSHLKSKITARKAGSGMICIQMQCRLSRLIFSRDARTYLQRQSCSELVKFCLIWMFHSLLMFAVTFSFRSFLKGEKAIIRFCNLKQSDVVSENVSFTKCLPSTNLVADPGFGAGVNLGLWKFGIICWVSSGKKLTRPEWNVGWTFQRWAAAMIVKLSQRIHKVFLHPELWVSNLM